MHSTDVKFEFEVHPRIYDGTAGQHLHSASFSCGSPDENDWVSSTIVPKSLFQSNSPGSKIYLILIMENKEYKAGGQQRQWSVLFSHRFLFALLLSPIDERSKMISRWNRGYRVTRTLLLLLWRALSSSSSVNNILQTFLLLIIHHFQLGMSPYNFCNIEPLRVVADQGWTTQAGAKVFRACSQALRVIRSLDDAAPELGECLKARGWDEGSHFGGGLKALTPSD